MRNFVFGLALVVAVGGGLAAQTPQDEYDLKQKVLREEIDRLQTQLDTLRKQQQELTDKKKEIQAQAEARRKEQERRAREQAEKKATHPELKELASKIAKDQQQEIKQMKSWAQSWFGPA